jgi:hypothetical protein
MMPLRFEKRLYKTKARGIAPRRLAAAKRVLKKQRDKYPLFTDQIAARQPTPEQRILEMDAKFVEEWDKLRQAACKKWLELRRIIRKGICPELKMAFLSSWYNLSYPADPYYASDFLLRLVKEKCTSCPGRLTESEFRCRYYSSIHRQEVYNG